MTAGNASTLNDGAACLLIASEAGVEQLGAEPLARVLSTGVAGVDPAYMGIGPVEAIPKALEKAGLTLDQIDLIEINEAFASQVLACVGELGIDEEKLNVNGGAIALGHPLGCSGARLTTTIVRELRRRGGRYGVASLCVGVGQGLATVFENAAPEAPSRDHALAAPEGVIAESAPAAVEAAIPAQAIGSPVAPEDVAPGAL